MGATETWNAHFYGACLCCVWSITHVRLSFGFEPVPVEIACTGLSHVWVSMPVMLGQNERLQWHMWQGAVLVRKQGGYLLVAILVLPPPHAWSSAF